LLAGLVPRGKLGTLRLIVTPGTLLRWHLDLLRRRWARRSRPRHPAAHRPTEDQGPHPATRGGQPGLGISADPRRTGLQPAPPAPRPGPGRATEAAAGERGRPRHLPPPATRLSAPARGSAPPQASRTFTKILLERSSRHGQGHGSVLSVTGRHAVQRRDCTRWTRRHSSMETDTTNRRKTGTGNGDGTSVPGPSPDITDVPE
jgi:hypothetical protein